MMEFRRIDRFPPYVFSIVNDLKMAARRAGEDIIDLGMGNPDIPAPEAVGAKLKDLVAAYEHSQPKPRVVLCSFPHNPTTVMVDLSFFEQLVEFARARGVMIVHDLAYADLTFEAERAPSLLQVPGARDVGVEFFSMSKSYSMPGWRVAFAVGNKEIIAALAKLKSYLDYGVFQ